MIIDDVAVFGAELQGLRRLAHLPRPKVTIRPEEVPGALCLWGPGDVEGAHRDDVRLVPGSGVPLHDVLRAIRDSRRRAPGGHLLIRGTVTSFDPAAVSLLQSLGAQRDIEGPHTLMVSPTSGALPPSRRHGAVVPPRRSCGPPASRRTDRARTLQHCVRARIWPRTKACTTASASASSARSTPGISTTSTVASSGCVGQWRPLQPSRR